jgi:hypothetical protein
LQTFYTPSPPYKPGEPNPGTRIGIRRSGFDRATGQLTSYGQLEGVPAAGLESYLRTLHASDLGWDGRLALIDSAPGVVQWRSPTTSMRL